MGRKTTKWIIVAIAVIVSAGLAFNLRRKLQTPRDVRRAELKVADLPFKNVIVELTFQSRSVHDGEEFLSSTGHRTEYIDPVNRHRREDYESQLTTLQQATSTASGSLIFDGRNVYVMLDKDGKRRGSVTDLGEGYDYPVWQDAAIKSLIQIIQQVRGNTLEQYEHEQQEEFLGRECNVFTLTSKDATTYKYWVWNGVILHSQSHLDIGSTVIDNSEEAVRVEENGDIAADLFSPPADVNFEPVRETPSQQKSHHEIAPWVRMSPDAPL